MHTIPVVDFSLISDSQDPSQANDESTVAQAVYKALSTIGFVYLVNHGVPTKVVRQIRRISKLICKLQIGILLNCYVYRLRLRTHLEKVDASLSSLPTQR